MIKLIKVEPDANNNKVYQLTPQGDQVLAEWGRVGAGLQSQLYPIRMLEKKRQEKLKKGYQDVTHLFLKNEQGEITNGGSLFQLLSRASKQAVSANYTIEAGAVTQAMVDEAQRLLNSLLTPPKAKDEVTRFNDNLVKLFQIIPRRMDRVSAYLFNGDHQSIIQREQDNLDSLASQVVKVVGTTTLEEAYGFSVTECDDQDVKIIQSKLKNFDKKLDNCWKLCNLSTQGQFDLHVASAKNQFKELLWHGSRNENWLSIVSKGLLIRPTNAVYTGSMFGDGIYFADKWQKSAGYSSLRGSYWTSGTDMYGLLALYEVHRGNSMEILRHNSSHYSLNATSLGVYDSVFAKGGADLRNNEYIVYRPQQCTIKYLCKLT